MAQGKATAVYIDGYNLYYGRLRGTPYKWLDVVALSNFLLREQDPGCTLIRLRYFSAPALARFATHKDASAQAQQSYHRALQQRYPDIFSLTLGQHSFNPEGVDMPRFVNKSTFDRNDKVRVWKIEEKKTDVNLALSMYRDAASGLFEHQVLFSNDSDAEPVMEAIRSDFPKITLGIVTTSRPPAEHHLSGRRVSTSLAKHADWVRRYLLDEELANSQLPDRISTKKKPIIKPKHW